MSKSTAVSKTYQLPFHAVRHISTPEDLEDDRRIYVGTAPLSAIADLPTHENVRDYLLDAEGKKRKQPTKVHIAIRDTLSNNREDFCVLNGGIVLVARKCEIDDKRKILVLHKASIVNGSQTQGVIRDLRKTFTDQAPDEEQALSKTHIKFEVIVTADEDLIAEISIARNFQNDVNLISIVGRRGQLIELEEEFQREFPKKKLKMSETHLSDEYVNTERLLQVIAALVPEQLWLEGKEFSKVYTYSRKAKCLKDFQEIFKGAKDKDSDGHQKYRDLYQFYLDIAPEAFRLHEQWKTHQGFKGSGLHALKRDKLGNILDVPDGIVFPILAAHAPFAEKTNGRWAINVPDAFTEDEFIEAAKSSYIEVAKSNPNVMGKSKGCYSRLYQIASIYKKLSVNRED